MTYPHPEPSPEGGNEPDLWDRVSVDAPRVVFGQLTMNLFECVLIKGQGKVPYDPYLHASLRKNVAQHGSRHLGVGCRLDRHHAQVN